MYITDTRTRIARPYNLIEETFLIRTAAVSFRRSRPQTRCDARSAYESPGFQRCAHLWLFSFVHFFDNSKK